MTELPDPAPAETPPQESSPAKRDRSPLRWLAPLAVLGILAGVGVLILPDVEDQIRRVTVPAAPVVPVPEPAPEMSAPASAAPVAPAPQPPPAAADLQPLRQELDALGGRIDQMARGSADAASVLRLALRIDRLEADLRDLQHRRGDAAARLLALGQLRAAVNLAQPFDAELKTVIALAGADAPMAALLAPLAARAKAGIPTRPMLSERFEALEPAVVRADILPAQGGWSRRAMERVLTLVTVRRETGEVAGASAAAVAARLRARLAAGDLAGAVTQGQDFSAAPAELLAGWLDDAKARLEADQILSEVTAQGIAAAGSGP